MNSDFAAAMHRALDHTRAGSLEQATAGIQAALAGAGLSDDKPFDASPPSFEGQRPGVTKPRIEASVSPKAPRRSLKDVVDALRRTRPAGLAPLMTGAAARSTAIRPSIPSGADYQSRTFDGAQGSRSYKLYVPSTHVDGVRGLVIMLHGCTQNPDDFAAGTGMNDVAEKHGLLIAYPGQTHADNASACWNWFRPGDQQRDLGEPAIIAGLTRALISEFTVEPERVFVAGFSAGGAMAAVMAKTYPDLFAAVGVHSGLPYGSASDVVSAFSAMRGDARSTFSAAQHSDEASPLRTIVFHGRADKTVHAANAKRIVEASGHHGKTAQKVPGHHERGRSVERTVWRAADGVSDAELWLIDGAGHAWAGGRPDGSYTDPTGPDASAEMIRFFLKDTSRGRSI